MIRFPTLSLPHPPEGADKDYLEALNAELNRYATALQISVRDVIDRKHAPILIPSVTIDAAHAALNLTAANASTIFAQLSLGKTASSSSATTQTAVNYTGRGILTQCLIMEENSGGTSAYNATLKITIDGNVVYNNSTAITRQSQIHVVVGNQIFVSSSVLAVTDAHPGLPFNKSCKIEYASDGSSTTLVSWKIAKKL